MIHIARWKFILSFLVCVYAIWIILPNILTESKGRKINLGLDLKGGAYLLLEIDFKSYFNEKINILKDEVRTKLKSAHINYNNLTIDNNHISLIVNNQKNHKKLEEELKNLSNDIEINYQKEYKIIITYNARYIREQKIKLRQQSLEIIRRRIDETGTKEPLIQPQGLNRIILQVPGIKNPERLKTILGKTAKLTFSFLHPTTPIAINLFDIPQNYEIFLSDEDEKTYYLVSKKVELTGETLNDASANIYQGQAQVTFKFDSQGTRKFGEITSKNVGKRLAILLDNKVISAPSLREPILQGSGVISGNFSVETANDLALLLRAGSLPAPLNIIEERTVGSTLGADSIAAGKKAVLIAFILVILLILVIYKIYGVFAITALIMNIVFIFAILTLIGATLTLPGIAGIVLTIGMAVDTNVLIFEKIREEARTGKSIYAVIDTGFNDAFKTILDSNITTLIVALVLFNFGSGPIKGFAFTLSAGIISSMFSAIFLTKILIYSWVKYRNLKKISL